MLDCVLIGSKAISKPSYRHIRDVDFLTRSDTYTSTQGCEFHNCGEYEGLNILFERNYVNRVMCMRDLYTLKLSRFAP